MTDARSIRAGRPRKIEGTSTRWWLYVSQESRDAAEERATRDGVELPDVLRSFLDAYAAGTVDAPSPAALEA